MLAKAMASTCRHCDRPTVVGEAFCCAGCEAVHAFLEQHNLQQFYELRRCETDTALPLRRPRPAQESYLYCDDPEFLKKYSVDGKSLTFYLEGVQCGSCLWLLEKLPEFQPGVLRARLSFEKSTLTVTRTSSGLFSAIASRLDQLGYTPHPLSPSENGGVFRQAEGRRHLVRLGVAAAGAGNIMLMSIAIYAGASKEFQNLFSWLSMAMALPVLTYSAWPIYQRVWKDLKSFRISLDLPIALALISGILLSVKNIFLGSSEVYFDSLTTLVFLLLGSRYLLRSAQNKNLGSTSHIESIFLGSIERLDPITGGIQVVSTLALRRGDKILMHPGTVCAVDGVVETGSIAVDASVLTGESEPRTLASGETVEAGFRVLSGKATVKIIAAGGDTRLAQLLGSADTATSADSKLIHLSEKVGQIFTWLVLLAAVGTVIANYYGGSLEQGLTRALALVIVSCPCVFGMAIPLALSSAMKSAAEKGAIVRDSFAIENLLFVKSAFLDKTGTLTTGKMNVIATIPEKLPVEYQVLANDLQHGSRHPVANAIRKHTLQFIQAPHNHPKDVTDLVGGGRRMVFAGHAIELRPLLSAVTAADEKIVGRYGLFRNGDLLATYVLQDQLKPDAVQTVRELEFLNVDVHLLSGDGAKPVMACAHQLGLATSNVNFSATPQAKVQILAQTENAMMVGDGANDAGALKAASVGIAVRGAIELSLQSASIYLLKPELNLVPWLIHLAKITRKTILICLLFSSTFNAFAAYFAMTGKMHPLIAAILMPLSSLTVLSITILGQKVAAK